MLWRTGQWLREASLGSWGSEGNRCVSVQPQRECMVQRVHSVLCGRWLRGRQWVGYQYVGEGAGNVVKWTSRRIHVAGKDLGALSAARRRGVPIFEV